MDAGYDHMDFVGPDVLTEDDLVKAVGVKDKDDLSVLVEAVKRNGRMKGTVAQGVARGCS